uniref:Uncharacterized protein n=1 Tax=Arundo donax TaxID=35708 RepID=A0A0A9BUM2_ARUDO
MERPGPPEPGVPIGGGQEEVKDGVAGGGETAGGREAEGAEELPRTKGSASGESGCEGITMAARGHAGRGGGGAGREAARGEIPARGRRERELQ